MIKPIFPKKPTKKHIRVVAPARSLGIVSQENIDYAIKRLGELGFTVSLGKHVKECDDFLSSSIQSRVEDLHEAFADNSVDIIMTAIGGYNANKLADHLDYELIKANPKVLCGFSDITALSFAIYAKTGLVTYSGPHFSSFAMKKGFEHSLEYFLKACTQDDSYEIKKSVQWSDDLWFIDQENRKFIDNEGPWIINNIEGSFEGTVIGTHMRCLQAYQGTQYWPGLNNSILFIEDDEEIFKELFDRNLQSLVQQADFSVVKAIIIGRFQNESKITREHLTQIVKSISELNNVPVIANIDFGHTTPITTLPIGGTAKVELTNGQTKITILDH